MDTDMILVPRAAVAALVDPIEAPFAHFNSESDVYRCVFCYASDIYPAATIDTYDHDSDCPVRIMQEALNQTDSHDLRGILTALANEMRTIGNDRVAEYGWRLTRILEDI